MDSEISNQDGELVRCPNCDNGMCSRGLSRKLPDVRELCGICDGEGTITKEQDEAILRLVHYKMFKAAMSPDRFYEMAVAASRASRIAGE